jgi:hypothetical protein
LVAVVLGAGIAGCGGGGGGSCAAGAIQVSWGFASGGACLPGDVVTVRLDNDNSQLADVPCDHYGGIISPVTPGPHTVDLTIFDANGNVLDQSVPPASINVPCGGTYTLPEYDFNL